MKNVFFGLLIVVLLTAGFFVKGVIGLGIAVFFIGGAILHGLRKIPADPPHKAAVTLFGERTGAVKNEGWRFFFLYPYWHGFILVDVTKKNQDLTAETVRTPDLAEIKIPVSVTWTPLPGHLIDYLNAGGEPGVRTILEDIIRERLREWAISEDQGPATWEDALKSREEAAAILIKAVIGEQLKQIPSSVPTSILLKFFSEPQKPPIESEKKLWGKNWERVEKILKEECKDAQERIKLRGLIEQRRKIINKIRQGNGDETTSIPQLGIVLNRLNVGEMIVLGEVAKAAELKAKETKERAGEILELEHVGKRIKALNKLGFSNEQALEVIQTERGKVKKDISETKLNISPETRAMIEKIGPAIVASIVGGGAQNV